MFPAENAENNDNTRPVWFVTGGSGWMGYIGSSGLWLCPQGHEHADTIPDMRAGDRIALKGDRFWGGMVGIWAIGRIRQNNMPDKFSVGVEWGRVAGGGTTASVPPLENCPLDGLGFSPDDCIWRVTRATDAGRTFIAGAFKNCYDIDDIISDGCFLERRQLTTMLQRLAAKRNIILQGPPGAGKTWLAKRLAYALVGSRDDHRVRPLQFHPNMSYEDFVRGWRPAGDGRLELVDGPFLRLMDDARQDPDIPYVMVIEEINRGNPAQIFGEMLTLLEADKRHPGEALALAYPRAGSDGNAERVHIPPNVYVIGTMNVADRSLALVDFALRRRFAFFDLEPVFGARWRNWVSANCGLPADFLADVGQRLTALNQRIADDRMLGKQFRIGHSVVTPAPGAAIADPRAWFAQVVDTEIAPLLDEYWFDNPEAADAAKAQLLAGL